MAVAPTYEQMKKALTLALAMLQPHEPPDSRMVSNEFVALAAMATGQCNDTVMAIIDKGLSDRNSQLQPKQEPKP